MAKVIWGLDLGDWALRVARATYDKKAGTITVDVMDTIVYGELPCGHDASPTEKHRAGIVAFRSRHEVGPRDDLCVCVSGGEVFSRFINLPPVLERMDEIIGYEARQQIPFDIDDVVWDWQPVKEEEQIEVGEEVEVGLFALKKERVAELMDLLEPWRGNLRIVQNAPLAACNLLDYEGLTSEPCVVVDMGSATTDVLVLNPPRFWVRTLLVAGDDLTNALTEQFGIGKAEAETIKRRLGRSTHKEQVLRILQPVFEDLTNEIQRSLGYYKSLAREVKFGSIVALGGTLEMAGLSQMLAAALQHEVKSIRELSRIRFAPSLPAQEVRSELPGFCAALGLLVQGAGEGRIRINMLPEDLAMASAVAAKKPWLMAAGVGLLFIAIVLSLGERLYAQDIVRVSERQSFTVLDEADKVDKEYRAQAAQVQAIEEQLAGLGESEVPRDIYLELLPLFSELLPDDVYVLQLRFEWKEPLEIAVTMPRIGDWKVATRRVVASRATTPTRRTMAAAEPDDAFVAAMMAADEAKVAAMIAAEEAARAAMFTNMGDERRDEGRSGPAGRGRGARAAARPTAFSRNVEPLASSQSRLVLRFVCESLTANKDYIEQQVFEVLRKASLRDGLKPAFTEVEMLGEVIDVYRDSETLETVDGPGPKIMRFAGFEGYAVVNVGPAGETVEAPTSETGRRSRRR